MYIVLKETTYGKGNFYTSKLLQLKLLIYTNKIVIAFALKLYFVIETFRSLTSQ